MSSNATLLDGTRITIDVALPSDTELVMAFASDRSLASRHERFFAGLGDGAMELEVRRELNDVRSHSLLARSNTDRRILRHALGAIYSSDRAEVAPRTSPTTCNTTASQPRSLPRCCTLCEPRRAPFEATLLPKNISMRGVFAASASGCSETPRALTHLSTTGSGIAMHLAL